MFLIVVSMVAHLMTVHLQGQKMKVIAGINVHIIVSLHHMEMYSTRVLRLAIYITANFNVQIWNLVVIRN